TGRWRDVADHRDLSWRDRFLTATRAANPADGTIGG
ncbi:MAG: hypothetical protein QOJ60_557, partial [Actinomycetota bacterium]|nr:hypothetical protein [Actinomycetota bacterium]